MDIDVDFANYGRYEVIEYCQAKYGFEKVCQIATFQTLGVKSIIKSVGKTQGLSFEETNEMTSNVPDKEIIDVLDEDGNPETKEVPVELLSQLEKIGYFKDKITGDERVENLFKIGKILEGLPSAASKHAAGVIIGRTDLMNNVPLMEVDGVMVSQFEKKAVESIGLLKMDFLGLKTLDILHECQNLIEENYGIKIDLDKIEKNDRKTFETIFKPGLTSNVFQFESSGMKNLLRRMNPGCMMDLCLANAAYRPGPMQFIDEFIEGRNNPSSVHYPAPQYEAIASETMGILFYQEQVMQIVQAMAGFTLGEADILRRGIGKKEKKYIDAGRIQFIEGCKKMGTADENLAKEIYSNIEKFANYGFNKSHSDAYGYVAYLCGYLKAHFPVCFMAANATVNADNPEKLASCLAEIQRMDIKLLPPDIRYSKPKFSVEALDGKQVIRYGLGAVRSIREDAAEVLLSASNKDSLFGFLSTMSAPARRNQIESLIRSGALDYLGRRKALEENFSSLNEAAKVCRECSEFGIPSLFDEMDFGNTVSQSEYSQMEKIEKERNAIQICLSGHPLSSYRNIFGNHLSISNYIEDSKNEESQNETAELLVMIDDIHEIRTKKGDTMAFIKMSDEFTSIEGIIFPRAYAEIKGLEENIPFKIRGRYSQKDNIPAVIIESAEKAKCEFMMYLRKNAVTDEIMEKMKEKNGVIPVNIVDTEAYTVERLPFCIDLDAELFSMLDNESYLLKK